MTESDWLIARQPGPLLTFLRARARSWTQRLLAWLGRGRRRDRKPRLFACACCRRIEGLLVEARLLEVVAVAEQRADGVVGPEELADACTKAAESPWGSAARAATCAAWEDAWAAAFAASAAAVQAVEWNATGDHRSAGNRERAAQAYLLRDLYGNPFHRVDEFRCSGATRESILFLARTIYAERAFDRLPDLADLLQKTGCASREVLEHFRGPGPHARGCWALDLVLGKE
jgi:hypothetical protein